MLGFRRGMYSKNVDFHTTDPTTWIKSQLEERGNPKNGFLYATILDMASPGDHLAAVGDALIADGIVGIFCPSITQIGECVKTVKTMRLPLVLETSVEFPGGSGGGAGLRAWDVRYARLRSKTEGLSVREAENRDTGEGKGEEVSDDEFGLVCRPNTFERVIGGGFFAMFRRRSRRSEAKLIQLKIERDAAAAAAALEPSEAQHSPVGLSSAEDIAEERIEEEGAADKNGVPM